jgi:glycosyltransferase involved in cell wall biosynthesis
MFRGLGSCFDVTVLISGHQDNRLWNIKHVGRNLNIRRAFGVTLKWRQRGSDNSVWEERYTHVNPGYLYELVRLRPQAVFSHEMGFRTLAALVYGLLFRVPVWVFWEGPLHTELRISRSKRLLRQHVFAHVVRRWVTCGESSTAYLASLGIPRDRILTAQNPVDEELYRSHVDPTLFDVPGPVALCVSRLTGLKGIDRLLRVCADLWSEELDFSLVIVGDGPEAPALKALANDLNPARVQWIPNVPFEQMPAVYRGADFLVFPTLADVWGLVVNEAIWSGTPVIASRYAGAALDILPKRNIFDPTDTEDFRVTMRRAIAKDIDLVDGHSLMTAQEVADMIGHHMLTELGTASRRPNVLARARNAARRLGLAR